MIKNQVLKIYFYQNDINVWTGNVARKLEDCSGSFPCYFDPIDLCTTIKWIWTGKELSKSNGIVGEFYLKVKMQSDLEIR